MKLAPQPSDRIVGEYLLSIHGVSAKVQIGKTKLMAMVKSGEFPQPKHIGSLQRWRGRDVDDWVEETFRQLGREGVSSLSLRRANG